MPPSAIAEDWLPIYPLWVAILVSAGLVFLASWLIHVLPLWHKGDFRRFPGEGALSDAVRPHNLPPGNYMIPRAVDPEEMPSDELFEQMERPVMLITVFRSGFSPMSVSLVLWFVYVVAVSCVTAALVSRGMGLHVDPMGVFLITAETAFIGYSMALWQAAIWSRRTWSLTLKDTFDGLIYALLTAGVFAWLWPQP